MQVPQLDDKTEKINSIIQDVFDLPDPKIEESRKSQIKDFIISTINGDNPIAHLAVNARLDKDNRGAILFIITDTRLIKIDISQKEIQSSSYPLNTIIGINRKLIDDGQSEFSIAFQNGSFGLRYPQSNIKISEFFQKIEAKE